jgi:putative colanic acid biosysnthesis UDP-glucose lipid carrier transferase
MSNRFHYSLQYIVVALDLFAINLAIWGCKGVMGKRIPLDFSRNYFQFAIAIISCWLLVSIVGGLYSRKQISSFESLSRRTLRVYAWFLLTVMLYLFFGRQLELSRLFIIVCLSSIGALLLLNRFCYLLIYLYGKSRNLLQKKVLILGYNQTAKKLAGYLEEQEMNTQIVGFCENVENIKELSNYPVVGSLAETMKVSAQNEVSEIYSTIAPEHDHGIYHLMKQADKACIHFKVVPDFSLYMKRAVQIDYVRDMPMLSARKEPLEEMPNRVRKRLFDIVVSSFFILFVLSWLVPLLGILIFLESPGAIFFRQARTGRRRKVFQLLKFRSMKINKESHLKQATRNDNRITRMGRFIRKTNLDEFPQFINVLKGEMSIVGPRPHMLKHTDDYSAMVDSYMVRQFLKPGLTGWAQVNGYRGEITNVEQIRKRVEHDIWYLENWGLWLDMRICFLTFWTMVKGDKNAF